MNLNIPFDFDNTYINQFPTLGSEVTPAVMPNPKWLSVSQETAAQLGLTADQLLNQPQWLDWFSGNASLNGAQPFAQKYTGHQFGHYNPDLGDGRGVLLGEASYAGQRLDLHVKGAGKTPYSRFGDGRAVLRSCIREYLASETMEALGIPTSRALGVFTTGEQVQRETLEPGAAMIRVCKSHLRFGHFEYAFYQNDETLLKQLVHYSVTKVLPSDAVELQSLTSDSTDAEQAAAMFKFIIRSTAELVAKWQAFGFCHGVMNTDNMSILGLTFDYGPYGFLDKYDPKHICNHSDHSGRYAFDEQPSIALWNLNALAYALSPLLNKEQLTDLLQQFEPILLDNYSSIMRQKLGLTTRHQNDQGLLTEFLQILQSQQRDYTHTWRALSTVSLNQAEQRQAFVNLFIERGAIEEWLTKYQKRLATEMISEVQRQELMCAINPKYILRNHLAQEAIEAAENGDTGPLDLLLKILSKPFTEQDVDAKYCALPPDWAYDISISCSS